jgi:hypothetical protein
MLTRERDRYKDEAETARHKNRENLQQTQEGIKAFKDQVRITAEIRIRVRIRVRNRQTHGTNDSF